MSMTMNCLYQYRQQSKCGALADVLRSATGQVPAEALLDANHIDGLRGAMARVCIPKELGSIDRPEKGAT